jgi:hypothetical protein
MFKSLFLTTLLTFSGSVQALDMCDSGSWYEPVSNGQGLSVEISDVRHRDRPNVVVYYYTYDYAGYPMWIVGVGNQNGGSKVELDFALFWGMTSPDFDFNDLEQKDGGVGTFTLRSSDTAIFHYNPSALLKSAGHIQQTFYMEKLFSICD